MEQVDGDESSKLKAIGGRPKREDDEAPLPHLSDVELFAAELAYDEVSTKGPNKYLEQEAKQLYPDKLRWVDANVKSFPVSHRAWKGHAGGYTFTMEESWRRRCKDKWFIRDCHQTVRGICNNFITNVLVAMVYNKDGSPPSGINRDEVIARVKDNIPYFHDVKHNVDPSGCDTSPVLQSIDDARTSDHESHQGTSSSEQSTSYPSSALTGDERARRHCHLSLSEYKKNRANIIRSFLTWEYLGPLAIDPGWKHPNFQPAAPHGAAKSDRHHEPGRMQQRKEAAAKAAEGKIQQVEAVPVSFEARTIAALEALVKSERLKWICAKRSSSVKHTHSRARELMLSST